MVSLPATSEGQPDWAYMDSFMADVMKESEACLEKLRLADEKKTAMDLSQWKEFEIGKLFAIVKGTRLTKANMREGKNRFIGSSAMNNGLTALIANNEKLHPANTITVCYNGSVGETFYQDEPFWASDDVNVLYPKFTMSKNIGLFLAPLIRSVGQRYAFVDKWRMNVMEKDSIKLPVDSHGEPDWKYMDAYMEEVMRIRAITLRISIVNGIKTPHPNTGRVFSFMRAVNHSGRKTRGKGGRIANFVGIFSEDPLKPSLFDL